MVFVNICLQVVADRPQHPLVLQLGARAPPILRMRAMDPLQAPKITCSFASILRFVKLRHVAIEAMAIEIVDLPIFLMVDLSSSRSVRLPENVPISDSL